MGHGVKPVRCWGSMEDLEGWVRGWCSWSAGMRMGPAVCFQAHVWGFAVFPYGIWWDLLLFPFTQHGSGWSGLEGGGMQGDLAWRAQGWECGGKGRAVPLSPQ